MNKTLLTRWLWVGLTGLLLGLTPVFAAAGSKSVEPIALGDLPLLFADDTGVAASHGVVRTLHAARTRRAPVIEPDRPWEGSRVYTYGSVHHDRASDEYRLWYMSRPGTENAGRSSASGQRAPGLRNGGFDATLYATSRDGVRWEKPALGLVEFDGSKANNIVFDLHSPSVLFDSRERDATRRYKMLGYLVGADHGYHAAFSADGVRWRAYPKSLVMAHGDTLTLTQHPVTGEYLAYHKRPAEIRGFSRRVVWLARSSDFQTWSEPELVFTADEIDDAWVSRPAERTEVYNMSVLPHAAGFIGLPAIFRVMTVRDRATLGPGQSPLDGPLDIQLATSADGRSWKRTSPRINVIPRGDPGTYDGGAILGVSSNAIHADNETWVYYTAINTGHGATMPPKRITIGRAEWRRHGFVSLDAGPAGGQVTTMPMRLSRPRLVLNADASRGEVRVALHDLDGKPLPGFNLEDAQPLRRNETRWNVAWRSGGAIPTDRPIQIVIAMTNVRLFSLSAGAEE